MGEGTTVPPAPAPGPLTMEETSALWQSFRDGTPAHCPRDDGPLALSVDQSNSYRIVCTRCGTCSTWFEVTPTGLRTRTLPPPPPGPGDE